MDYSWATHQPLIKAMLDLIDPTFVLEIGVGNYSTPLFEGRNYLGVENDPKWIETIQKNHPWANIQHHDLNTMNFQSRNARLNKNQRIELFNYYNSLKIDGNDKKLAFIDGYACTRHTALTIFKNKFDFIIYHDAQPSSDGCYDFLKVDVSDFHRYYLTSPKAWTCVLMKEDLGEELKTTIQSYIAEFKKEWNNAKINQMEVING